MASPPLVLGSTSRFRRELLERLGVPFECDAPQCDESPTPESPVDAESVARLAGLNAAAKAISLVGSHPGQIVIGSDQVCVCEGTILSKPGSDDGAIEQLRFLAGKVHHLVTAVALVHADTEESRFDIVTTELKLRELTDREIEAYVEREHPVDAAGSYYSEGLGIALFEYLRGEDPTAIIGLPLVSVSRLLCEFGISPLESSSWRS